MIKEGTPLTDNAPGTAPRSVPNKREIRREVLTRRDSMAHDLREIKDEKIKDRLSGLPEFKGARRILFYASFRSEVDTSRLIRYAVSGGKTAILPKVDRVSRTLMLYEVRTMQELAPGYWGIPEPSVPEQRRMNADEIDLIIVPGVAFDEECNRLGYGGGYYDRLLAITHAPALALAYEEQILSALPSEPHDIKMKEIVTDWRVIRCNEPQQD